MVCACGVLIWCVPVVSLGQGVRMIRKLKYEHIKLTFSKMRVDLAAQVMFNA